MIEIIEFITIGQRNYPRVCSTNDRNVERGARIGLETVKVGVRARSHPRIMSDFKLVT